MKEVIVFSAKSRLKYWQTFFDSQGFHLFNSYPMIALLNPENAVSLVKDDKIDIIFIDLLNVTADNEKNYYQKTNEFIQKVTERFVHRRIALLFPQLDRATATLIRNVGLYDVRDFTIVDQDGVPRDTLTRQLNQPKPTATNPKYLELIKRVNQILNGTGMNANHPAKPQVNLAAISKAMAQNTTQEEQTAAELAQAHQQQVDQQQPWAAQFESGRESEPSQSTKDEVTTDEQTKANSKRHTQDKQLEDQMLARIRKGEMPQSTEPANSNSASASASPQSDVAHTTASAKSSMLHSQPIISQEQSQAIKKEMQQNSKQVSADAYTATTKAKARKHRKHNPVKVHESHPKQHSRMMKAILWIVSIVIVGMIGLVFVTQISSGKQHINQGTAANASSKKAASLNHLLSDGKFTTAAQDYPHEQTKIDNYILSSNSVDNRANAINDVYATVANPNANLIFDHAYFNQSWGTVIDQRNQVDLNVQRKVMLSAAYLAQGKVDQAQKIADEVNLKPLNQRIQAYKQLTDTDNQIKNTLKQNNLDDSQRKQLQDTLKKNEQTLKQLTQAQ